VLRLRANRQDKECFEAILSGADARSFKHDSNKLMIKARDYFRSVLAARQKSVAAPRPLFPDSGPRF